jgi:hypothetical protein
MTTTTLVVGAYRRLVRLYPRAFRDEFGTDLVDLLTEQLRDEPTGRVVARGLIDLALTVPTQHLEAHMDRSPNTALTCALGALAFATTAVGVAVGHPAVLVGCLAVGITLAGLALLNARRGRPLTDAKPIAVHWWKPTAAGIGLLLMLIAVTTATGELPDGGWYVAMITLLTALLLIGTGLVLGILHLTHRPTRRATA